MLWCISLYSHKFFLINMYLYMRIIILNINIGVLILFFLIHSLVPFIWQHISTISVLFNDERCRKKPGFTSKAYICRHYFSIFQSLYRFYVYAVYSRVCSRNNLQSAAHAGCSFSLLSFQDPLAPFLFARKNQQSTCLIADRLRIRALGVSRNQIIALFRAMSVCDASINMFDRFLYTHTIASNRVITDDRRTQKAFVI